MKTEEEIQKLQDRLDQLLEKSNLSETAKFINNHSKKALELTHEQMRTMSKEDLYEAAILLKQYALKIKVDENRYSTVIDWCKDLINAELAEEDLSEIYNYDLKVAALVKQNEYAKKVFKIMRYNRAYKQQLENLSWAITQQANTIENFARGKSYG